MKKEELNKIKLPLQREDFEKLKCAFDNERIERADVPLDILLAMDKMWATDNEEIYKKHRETGLFGEYD